ncbi:thioredoxin family protein [Deltaproteobacteria bacterium OttesenSCG-928-K17]|nr:thioredoxin family protein [Deltaproteobacteria bacterium OttesenSCG-928-K17]
MLVIDKDNFEQEVLKSEMPVIVDFWGPQCAPCLALMPDVEKLAEELDGKVKIGKLNSAENRRFCMSLKIMGLPTFLFYKGGELQTKLSGDEVNIDSIRAAADKLLA